MELAPTFAFFFALGIPALFVFLVYRFKKLGKSGDKVVARALGWLYSPYREQKEWWLGLVRKYSRSYQNIECAST